MGVVKLLKYICYGNLKKNYHKNMNECSVGYQLYKSIWINDSLLAVAGGGGRAKSGFSNGLTFLRRSGKEELTVAYNRLSDREIAYDVVYYKVCQIIFAFHV